VQKCALNIEDGKKPPTSVISYVNKLYNMGVAQNDDVDG
jgi:hypothetical protein